jgi:hypothetical protein
MELLEYKKPKAKFQEQFEEFNLIYHAAIACMTSDQKPIFRNIYSDGKIIAGSDASSLHVSKIKMKAGLYKVLVRTKTRIVLHYEKKDYSEYPKIQAIIPVRSSLKNFIRVSFSSYYSSRASSYSKIIKHLHKENGIDSKFLDKLINGSWYVYTTGTNNLVAFYDHEFSNETKKSAFIMPIQLPGQ